jgi:uncharacterized protein with ParB-like and HNH nuclease domain
VAGSMITDAQNRSVSQLFDNDQHVVYNVPRYQREYKWGKPQLERLFDDILENNEGYFLGSIICINQAKIFEPIRPLELVDGQQRMAALSLLYAAIYSKLEEYKGSMDEDQSAQKNNLKWRLILKKKDSEKVQDPVRLVLQTRENNYRDYKAAIDEAVFERNTKPPYAKSRKIFKAYDYFKERIDTLSDQADAKAKVDAIMNLLEKTNKSTLVIIEVANHSDAYTLFESLNNRGMPLTPIDIIKNKLPAGFEKQDSTTIDGYYKNWDLLLDYLGDDYVVQERFFRQYYNAFRNCLNGSPNIPMATRANLVKIYENLIESDTQGFLDKLLDAGKRYSFILGLIEEEELPQLIKPLKNLERIQGTPSYLLLLYLLAKKNSLHLSQDNLCEIVQRLVSFFVRRNLTDVPPTRDLTRLFMGIVSEIASERGNDIVRRISDELIKVSSNDETFRERLNGPMYSDNYDVVRFILCSLEENAKGKEALNLWKRDEKHKQFIWTIEHIFPEGEPITPWWVEMIADGDQIKAKELQDKHVHRMGNLTITGYNSNLGNLSFMEKRDKTDKKTGKYIGYKNGLYLNEDLKDGTKWTEDDIVKRTKLLMDETQKLFPLKEDPSIGQCRDK